MTAVATAASRPSWLLDHAGPIRWHGVGSLAVVLAVVVAVVAIMIAARASFPPPLGATPGSGVSFSQVGPPASEQLLSHQAR